MALANPWDSLGVTDQPLSSPEFSQDPAHQQAIQGYAKAVAAGQVTPEEGVARLKKFGAISGKVKPEDLHPLVQQEMGQPAEASQMAPDGFVGPTSSLHPAQGSATPGGPSVLAMSQNPTGANPLAMGDDDPSMKVNLSHVNDIETSNTKDLHSVTSRRFDPTEDRARLIFARGHQVPYSYDDKTGKYTYDFGNETEDPNHPISKMGQSLDKLQEVFNMGNSIDAGKGPLQSVNLAPLAALARTWNKQSGFQDDTGEGYVPPQTPESSRADKFKELEALQKNKMDLQRGVYENMKTNTPSNTIQDTLAAMAGMKHEEGDKDAINSALMRQEQQNWTKAQTIHQANIQGAKRDPVLQAQLKSINSVANVFDLLQKNPNPQIFSESMQNLKAVTTGLTGGQKSGVEERMADYMPSIERDWKNLVQAYGNKVENIPKNDPQFMQLSKELVQARGAIASDLVNDAIVRTGGFDYIYNKYPKLEESRKAWINSISGLSSRIPVGMNEPAIKEAARKAGPKKGSAPPGATGDAGTSAPSQPAAAASPPPTAPKPLQAGNIRVKDVRSGVTGQISEKEFKAPENAGLYQRIR